MDIVNKQNANNKEAHKQTDSILSAGYTPEYSNECSQ